MSPARAVAYIKSFGLPHDEEILLIALDVQNRTYSQLVKDGYSPEVIKRRRRRAYQKIAGQLEHE